MQQTADHWVDEFQAAEFLGVSVKTMRTWRLRGDGPPFGKFGRSVRYRWSTLTGWANSRERNSTSANADSWGIS
ncbi:MAG TPA: helix-turn-helix domain-containing protein [Verrucomicrobiae bacterium]|nr:helix-turn-helix domain-containing protein [Verrucomicrobiae bacterium]